MKNEQIKSNSLIFNTPDHIDFEGKKDEADKWGRENFGKWFEKKLSPQEREALISLPKNSYIFNLYLRYTQGKLTDLPETKKYLFKNYKIDELIQEIKTVDSALSKIRTSTSMIVYNLVDETFFGLSLGSLGKIGFFEDINESKYREITEKFGGEQIKITDFFISSLTNIHSSYDKKNQNILLKIFVPKGTNAGYLGINSLGDFGRSSMVIGRNQTLLFKHFKIINDDLRQKVVVEAAII